MPTASQAVFERAFSQFAEVSGLSFTPAEPDQIAEIDIASSTAGAVAWAYFPGFTRASGDIWFNLENDLFSNLANPPARYDGEYTYHSILHEMGHAMGLEHGHQGLASAYDGMEYTVMTYRSYVGDPTATFYNNFTGNYAQSLMLLDIAALQEIYGANWSTASGNTSYHFNPDDGQITRDGDALTNPSQNVVFATLWDGGGNDTLDFSDYTTDLAVDLRPGEGSDLDVGGTDQRARLSFDVNAPSHFYVSIAPEGDARALFENATGGSGADSFIGNAAENIFRGGLGQDSYTGLGGADAAIGTMAELAGDRFRDFSGGDEILIEDFGGEVTGIATGAGLQLSFAGKTLLLEGEHADKTYEARSEGGETSISIAGAGATRLAAGGERFITTDAGSNRVYGEAGDDVVVSSAGDDILSGGGGFDVLLGGDDADILLGGTSGDRLTGGQGSDIFSFNINDFDADALVADFITDFEIGVDKIELTGFGFSGLGDLDFEALAVGDAIDLGIGYIVLEGISATTLSASDILTSNHARAMSLISVGTQHFLTDAADRFVANDSSPKEVFAGAGIDAVIGSDGSDILRGEADGDVLKGAGGADRLIGGQGSDRMSGGAGADRFEFASGEETGTAADFITDYSAEDTVQLTGFGYDSFSDLSFGTAASGDITLELTASHFVIFEGVTETSTLASAFDFA